MDGESAQRWRSGKKWRPERGKDEAFCKSCSICKCLGNFRPCDEFATEEKIHDPREDMFRYSCFFLDYVDVNNSFMLAGVDHPLLYQHLIACTAQTCRMHMLHIRERLSVPIICPLQTKISSCNTGLPLEMTWKPSSICLQSFGTKWIGDAISWAQAVERRIRKWWTVAPFCIYRELNTNFGAHGGT